MSRICHYADREMNVDEAQRVIGVIESHIKTEKPHFFDMHMMVANPHQVGFLQDEPGILD